MIDPKLLISTYGLHPPEMPAFVYEVVDSDMLDPILEETG
jgi:hypothetical protein